MPPIAELDRRKSDTVAREAHVGRSSPLYLMKHGRTVDGFTAARSGSVPVLGAGCGDTGDYIGTVLIYVTISDGA